ncbi:MAG TPA: prolyl oligopeptidase family serine peptidase [Bacteroidales bacterium]|nr:prolyl oligopeptidase family serine peptidase [Bacteroidales bacterium]
MKRILRVIAGCTLLWFVSCSPQSKWTLVPGQHPQSWEKKISYYAAGHFLLFLPEKYGQKDQTWPMILFLHGSGERGTNLELVKKQGPPRMVDTLPDFPFIVVSPQAPGNGTWVPEELNALMEILVHKLAIDRSRIYLTGLSMGGRGTWEFATEYPEWFAAIAPLCGGGDPDRACRLKEVPVWAFHGAQDNVVPIKEQQDMVDALKECGGDVKFTIYPDAGHDVWTKAYAGTALYNWFLEHKKIVK